ncbi:hypothetical protein FB45DRAFT_907808 [Roridomyces roridus]|uniref:Uncharacterized protein n=1 Tax=Roridomyces roridus TaxID=1738132 RepID=A0AAD7C289_9AGAR|nr:hypothetical protein FB45DRAFT_907808 [Roridomyces roridus]
MAPKRCLDSPSSSSPRKRRQLSPPYPPFPSDSPSNPFGRTRTWNLLQALPPPTSFAKHLPLRFQYVKRGSPRASLEGVYRVVQVPQSYTLVHLKSLINFLFGGAYGQIPPSVEEEEEAPPYMFEIKKGISMYSATYKPGQIKKGSTWAFASGMLDPYLYYPDEEEEEGDDEEKAPSLDEPVDERKWAAEEDMTIAHVWPEGGDVTRGIVYQHTPNLCIHITVNTLPINTRRGKGNLPYVFRACGLVYMEEPEEDEELEEEDPTATLDPSNWNEPEESFKEYYGRHTLLPFTGYQKEAEAKADTSTEVPSLTFSSSPLRASFASSSSPSLATSSPTKVDNSVHIFSSSPNRFPKYTPAPKPAQRKRIRHLQQRIGNLSRASAEDEVLDLKKKRLKTKQAVRARSVEL